MQKIITRVMIFLLTIFSFIATTQANSTPTSATDNKIIATFFGIWTETRDDGSEDQIWEQKLNEDTPLDKVNRVYIAFADPALQSDGHYDLQWYLPDEEGNQQTELADFRVKDLITSLKNKHPNDTPDIFVVIGQGTIDNNGSLEDAAKDQNFPTAVIQFLKKYGLNGVDIDWETPTKEELTNMINLLQPIRDNGYSLTIDVWPDVRTRLYDSSLPQLLDQINIMSYGKYRDAADEAKDYMSILKFQPLQIIGGIETESDYSEAGGVDTLGPDGSIQTKVDNAFNEELSLAGMMSWRLGNDYAPSTNKNEPTYQGAVCLYQAMTTSQGCQ
jgi:GH18 family chitinase